ncbi:uncharacterized protein [Aristolochia californica]|uniref:uncharacterized protein n=1 Tax=Aristolochia californica TaxID=171875 RepID=UPI0035DE3192
MEFCPNCANLLQVEQTSAGNRFRLFCPTCPYVCEIKNKIVKNQFLVQKEVEAIFSGEDALKNAPKTEATCPACNFGQAYFRQMQIRSADEPMSTFYKCCNGTCNKEWRED